MNFPSARENIVLTLDLEGQLTTSAPNLRDQIWANFLGEGPNVYLSQVTDTLERAAVDKYVKSVFMDISKLEGGLSHFTALRRALDNFRASKKPLIVYSLGYDHKKFFLASAAPTVALPPLGSVEILGPMAHLFYFADALGKLGIEIEVFRAGKYKSAFEPLVANKPTEPTLEEYTAITQSVASFMQQSIATSRGIEASVVESWFKRSLFTSEETLSMQLVDRVAYQSEILAELLKEAKLKDDATLEYRDYLSVSDGVLKKKVDTSGNGIAFIEAEGEVWTSAGNDASSKNINIDDMKKQFDWARKLKEAKAVVLRIDSPGGSALASEIIWYELNKLAAVKPVIISMGEVAASGGYYIAAAGQKILAEPTTITGSIGVIGMVPKAPKVAEKFGINMFVIGESDRKGLVDFSRPSTPEDKELVGKSIDEVYHKFLQRVADSRKISIEQAHALAQGRVYTGMQAKELGLVDELGGLKEAYKEAKILGGLKTDSSYPVFHYKNEGMSLFSCLRKHSLGKCIQKMSKQSRGVVSRFGWLHNLPKQAESLAQRIQEGEKSWALWIGKPY